MILEKFLGNSSKKVTTVGESGEIPHFYYSSHNLADLKSKLPEKISSHNLADLKSKLSESLEFYQSYFQILYSLGLNLY